MTDLYRERLLELRHRCCQLEKENDRLMEENTNLKEKIRERACDESAEICADVVEEPKSKAKKQKAKKKKLKQVNPDPDRCMILDEPENKKLCMSAGFIESEKNPPESTEIPDELQNLPAEPIEPPEVARVNVINVVEPIEKTFLCQSSTDLSDEDLPCQSCSGTGLYPIYRSFEYVRPVHQNIERRRDFSCFYCHKIGHRAFECRKKLRLCFRCGSSNHLVPDCDERSRARNEIPEYRRACFVCGDEKHIARTCEKRYTRTGVIYAPLRYENHRRDDSS